MSEISFHILTLFPEMISGGLRCGVIGRAALKGILSFDVVNIRDYTSDKHGKVDDYPYGGGAGMLIQAQPVYDAYRAVAGGRKIRTIYVTPQGTPFTKQKARELAAEKELVFLCGHYEGIDERVLEEIVTDNISIGDYVLTGGELPAMVMIDAIARLVPGVLGNHSSAEEESFHNDLLEYPQYSRPEEWQGKKVPEVLLSGDHRKVAAWRLQQAETRTALRRPDLYEKYSQKQCLIRLMAQDKRNKIHMTESLARGYAEILYSDIREKEVSALLYDRDRQTVLASAADEASGRELADYLPEDTKLAVVSEPFMKELLEKRHYRVLGVYSQVLYTGRESLSVKHKDIRQLSMEHYVWVCRRCCDGYGGIRREYIRKRIMEGDMYGAFVQEQPAGVIGFHEEGSLGMLFVEESFRGQGLGASLESYAVNRMLEKGRVPYGYVEKGNLISEKLQEKLGFYKAEKTFWRLEKMLANRC